MLRAKGSEDRCALAAVNKAANAGGWRRGRVMRDFGSGYRLPLLLLAATVAPTEAFHFHPASTALDFAEH